MTEQKSFGWAQNDGSSLHVEMVQTVYSTVQYSTVQCSTVQCSTVVSLGPGLAWRLEEMDFKLNFDPISCCQAAVLATLPVSCSHSPPADRGAGGGWRGRWCGPGLETGLSYSFMCLYLCASIWDSPSTAYWHFLTIK